MKAVVLLAAAFLAGCVSPAAEAPVETTAAADPMSAPVAFETLEWSGHVMTSTGEVLTHFRPTEDVLRPVEQEGILVDVPEGITALEVALHWEGPGEFMIMLHSHKGEGGYVEHITELDDVDPKCLRVPAEDVTAGHWQVMVHSQGAQQTDFTLEVLTVGGAATMLDERHGHATNEAVTGNDIDKHEPEACTMYVPDPAHEH